MYNRVYKLEQIVAKQAEKIYDLEEENKILKLRISGPNLKKVPDDVPDFSKASKIRLEDVPEVIRKKVEEMGFDPSQIRFMDLGPIK